MRPIDHEKLQVYQSAIAFIAWTLDLLDSVPKSASVHNQLDRASTSIPLNITEGNGTFTPLDRCKYFDNARASSLECAAALDVLVAKSFVERKRVEAGKLALVVIVSMLTALFKATSGDRRY